MNENASIACVAPRGCWASAKTQCWSCGKETVVTALVALPPVSLRQEDRETGIDHPVIVYGVYDLRPDMIAELQRINPDVWLDNTLTAGDEYFMNHCRYCCAKIRDHDVVKVGGPVLALDDAALAEVHLIVSSSPVNLQDVHWANGERLSAVLGERLRRSLSA